jgi:hypothetical protein
MATCGTAALWHPPPSSSLKQQRQHQPVVLPRLHVLLVAAAGLKGMAAGQLLRRLGGAAVARRAVGDVQGQGQGPRDLRHGRRARRARPCQAHQGPPVMQPSRDSLPCRVWHRGSTDADAPAARSTLAPSMPSPPLIRPRCLAARAAWSTPRRAGCWPTRNGLGAACTGAVHIMTAARQKDGSADSANGSAAAANGSQLLPLVRAVSRTPVRHGPHLPCTPLNPCPRAGVTHDNTAHVLLAAAD